MLNLGDCSWCGKTVLILDPDDEIEAPICTCIKGYEKIAAYVKVHEPAWSWTRLREAVTEIGRGLERRTPFLQRGIAITTSTLVHAIEDIERAASQAERTRFPSSWERLTRR